MKLGLLILGILIFTISFASASFVCGTVNGTQTLSPSWLNIITYYEEDISKVYSCQTNPQEKFCCDLEKNSSTLSIPGKKVFAEVFDQKTKIVSAPVEIELSEEGYDIFPTLNSEKAIEIVPFKQIIINKTKTSIKIKNSRNYPNLKYTLSNKNSSISKEVCSNCTSAKLTINLSKGENQIEVTAYNNYREISIKKTIYSLDYLIFKRKMECQGCISTFNNSIVPPQITLNMVLTLNSSHLIKGELVDYLPIGWTTDSTQVEDYKRDHEKVKFDVEGSIIQKEYLVSTPPLIFPKIYEFRAEIGGRQFNNSIRVTRFSRWPHFLYLKKALTTEEPSFPRERGFSISPRNPLVLRPEDSRIKIIAIYPKKEFSSAHATISSEKNLLWKRSQTRYKISTTLRNEDIEKILIQYKVDKEKSHKIIQDYTIQDTILDESDDKFNYFKTYLNNKNEFAIALD